MQDGLRLKKFSFGRKNFRVIICLNLGDSYPFFTCLSYLAFYSELKIKMSCKRQSSCDKYFMSSYPLFEDNFDDIVCKAI